MPSISTDSCKIGDPMASPSYVNVEFNEKDSYAEIPSESDIHIDSSDDAWLNICEIPLFSHPTSTPPPCRPPPTVPADMKEATDRAEAKFRQSKEMREREYANTARDGENAQVKKDEQERENSENEERLESERRQRKEEEHSRLERERERAREEREKARQAVERATREARERAASEAHSISEREAVQRVLAEARRRAAEIAKEKAEKEAKERANAEIREKAVVNARAEAEARCRAEQAAVDMAAAEARERAANAARINQQNNENARTNQQNNENVRMNQQSNENVRVSQQHRNENDLESFFSTNSRPSSVPGPRDSAVDPVFQSRVESEPNNRTSSVNTTASVRKTSSAANLFDDLSSIFGGTVSSGDFQDVDGETEERRRTRLDRHQQTQERVAKALAEKNERDLQSERDQEERHRIGKTLDKEIGKWAAGKDGNLRALLSTMQYVLWPECGWTPVSLTDLITGASVKKVYRKATLCIHPDKVQQKGANLQQKYIAEKVFDLLKEAWNKFNSEELF